MTDAHRTRSHREPARRDTGLAQLYCVWRAELVGQGGQCSRGRGEVARTEPRRSYATGCANDKFSALHDASSSSHPGLSSISDWTKQTSHTSEMADRGMHFAPPYLHVCRISSPTPILPDASKVYQQANIFPAVLLSLPYIQRVACALSFGR